MSRQPVWNEIDIGLVLLSEILVNGAQYVRKLLGDGRSINGLVFFLTQHGKTSSKRQQAQVWMASLPVLPDYSSSIRLTIIATRKRSP